MNELESFGAIDSVYPIFDERDRNNTYLLVIASDGVLYGVALEDDEWADVEAQELDGGTENSILTGDSETLEQVQQSVMTQLD